MPINQAGLPIEKKKTVQNFMGHCTKNSTFILMLNFVKNNAFVMIDKMKKIYLLTLYSLLIE